MLHSESELTVGCWCSGLPVEEEVKKRPDYRSELQREIQRLGGVGCVGISKDHWRQPRTEPPPKRALQRRSTSEEVERAEKRSRS